MYNVVRQGDSDQYDVLSFSADTREDIQNLPTNCAQGSTCIVIEDSSVWMLNGNHVWQELKTQFVRKE